MQAGLGISNYSKVKATSDEWDRSSKAHGSSMHEKNSRLLCRLITDVSRVSNKELIKFLFSKNLHVSAQQGKGLAIDKEITKAFTHFRYCSSMSEFLQKFGTDRQRVRPKYSAEEDLSIVMANLWISQQSNETNPKLPDEILFPKINELVEKHLEPYLNGTITPETEDRNRPALTKILMQKLKEIYPKNSFDENLVRDRALTEYLYISASRLNACLFSINKELIDPSKEENSAALDFYLQHLNHAVRIDFSDHNYVGIDALGKKVLGLLCEEERKTRTRKRLLSS